MKQAEPSNPSGPDTPAEPAEPTTSEAPAEPAEAAVPIRLDTPAEPAEWVYLVTGAAGHLGSAVVRALLACRRDDAAGRIRNNAASNIREGGACRIRALVMPGDPATAKLPAEVERCPGDLLDPASLDTFFAVPAGTGLKVVHCAGIVSTRSDFCQKMYDVNVQGTKNILAACVRHSVRKLVYVSSVHAIPLLPDGTTMQEVLCFDAATVNGPYARTKAEATASVLQAAAEGLDATIVCPTGIIGPYDSGRGHITQLIIDFCHGRLPAIVPGGFDFVDVRDVAAGIVAALAHGKPGESYILGNRFVSAAELLDLLQAVTGRRRTRIVLPLWLARAFVPLLGLYYRLRGQTPLVNAYSLSTLTDNSDYSHEKAARELGYTARPMQETLRDTVDWLKQEGRIPCR